MSPFPAKYDGRCQACNERIYADDMVTFDDDRLVHADCDSIPQAEVLTGPACERCFLIRSLTGVCGCDE